MHSLPSTHRCPLCQYTSRTGVRLCEDHYDALTWMLDPTNPGAPAEDIPAGIALLHAMLNPRPGGGDDRARRAPGFHSTPPASPHVIAMRDERSRNAPSVWYPAGPTGQPDWTKPHTEEPHPPRAVRRALQGLFDSILEESDRRDDPTELEGPRLHDGGYYLAERTVPNLCAYLHSIVDAVAARPDVADIFRDLIELSDQLRRAVGDSPAGPDGWCLELIRDRHYDGYRECGGPLKLLPPTPDPPEDTPERARARVVAVCPRCYRRYTWLDMIRARYVRESA